MENNLLHMYIFIIVPKPIGKGCYRCMNLFSSFVLVRCLWSRLGGTSRGGGWSRINEDSIFLLVDLVVHLLSRSKCVNNIQLVDRRILNFIRLIGVFRVN